MVDKSSPMRCTSWKPRSTAWRSHSGIDLISLELRVGDETNLQRVRHRHFADDRLQNANYRERVGCCFENDLVVRPKPPSECDEAFAIKLDAPQLYQFISVECYGL